MSLHTVWSGPLQQIILSEIWVGQDLCKHKKMKYKMKPKKHLTSKLLDQHVQACASAQSDQGLWVFAVGKDLHENIWPTKFQISMFFFFCFFFFVFFFLLLFFFFFFFFFLFVFLLLLFFFFFFFFFFFLFFVFVFFVFCFLCVCVFFFFFFFLLLFICFLFQRSYSNCADVRTVWVGSLK